MYVNLNRFILPGTGAVALALKVVVNDRLFDQLLDEFMLLNVREQGRCQQGHLVEHDVSWIWS